MAISIRDGTYVAVAIDSSTVALTDVIAIVITVSVAVALTLTLTFAIAVSLAVAILSPSNSVQKLVSVMIICGPCTCYVLEGN